MDKKYIYNTLVPGIIIGISSFIIAYIVYGEEGNKIIVNEEGDTNNIYDIDRLDNSSTCYAKRKFKIAIIRSSILTVISIISIFIINTIYSKSNSQENKKLSTGSLFANF